jgi:imidazole glycerol-phosphate synthase subunit HisF
MLRPRITPCLLVHRGGLVKTVNFKAPKYVGDPINAVKIFNEKEADELIVLDIDATATGAEPDYQMIRHLATECRMPLCYGGGIKTAEQASKIVALGVEKVAISAAAVENPSLISQIADQIGRQSVAVVIDYHRKSLGRGLEVRTHNGSRGTKLDPIDFARDMARLGAGEIVLNSIGHDGKMDGYDLATAEKLRKAIDVPMTILGGAGSLDHMRALFQSCGVVGAAAGSFFVFKGPYKAVLITYPSLIQKDSLIHVQ